MKVLSRYKDAFLIGILIIFHIIGLVLMISDPSNAELSYLNLALCAVIVLIAEGINLKSLGFFALVFAGGIFIEWIGVETGYLFGDYDYGAALGAKIDGIPYVMGFNWYCIVLAGSAIFSKWKIHWILKAILAGIACTALDVLIEPVAIHLDYWDWNTPEIPIFNYVCWWIFTALFAAIYFRFSKNRNKPAMALYGIWVVFFTVLNLTQ